MAVGVADGLGFGDEVELFDLDGFAGLGDLVWALIGDGPGFFEVGAAASEAESHDGFGGGLVLAGGGEFVDLAGASGEDLELAVLKLHDLGGLGGGRGIWRQHRHAHLSGAGFADEIDLSGLGLGVVDGFGVELLAEVGLGGGELLAGGVHLGEDGGEAGGLGLGAWQRGDRAQRAVRKAADEESCVAASVRHA